MRFEREIDRLRRSGLVPLPLCKPTDGGGCSATAHDDCESPGKRPLLRGFDRLTVSAVDRGRVVSVVRRVGSANLGVVTGRGIIVVEADSPDAADEVIRVGGKVLDRTVMRAARPGRGPAWFFKTTVPIASQAHLGASHAIDIRGEKGVLVVPPSVHADGHRYRWVRAPWTSSIVDLPSALFRIIARRAQPVSVEIDGAEIQPQITARVAMLLRSHHRLARLWDGDGRLRGDTSASGYDFALAMQLLALRVPAGEVEAAIAARSNAHRGDTNYVRSTVANAHRALFARRRR